MIPAYLKDRKLAMELVEGTPVDHSEVTFTPPLQGNTNTKHSVSVVTRP